MLLFWTKNPGPKKKSVFFAQEMEIVEIFSQISFQKRFFPILITIPKVNLSEVDNLTNADI